MSAEQISKILGAFGVRCGQPLTEWEMDIYLEELAPYGIERLAPALRRLYLDLKGRGTMPSVNEILTAVGGKVDKGPMTVKEDARDVASRIISAVSRYGSMTETGSQGKAYRARPFIGEFGWLVMERKFGSWLHLCDVSKDDNEATNFAQLRDLAETLLEKAARGQLDLPPSVPQPALPDAPRFQLPNVIDITGDEPRKTPLQLAPNRVKDQQKKE